jgi:signal transduction histidine kinase
MNNEDSCAAANESVEALGFEDVLAEISTALVRATANEIFNEIEASLCRIGLALGIDRATIGRINLADGLLYTTHQWARTGIEPNPRALNVNEKLPWLTGQILAGEPVVLSRVEDAPPEAVKDLEYARNNRTKSTVTLPLKIGGVIVGGVAFDAVTHERTWSHRTVRRLRLIAEVFGNALERERAVAEVRHLQEEMRRTSRIATMGELTASLAHELSQPLGAILSNAQAARRLLVAKKPDLEEVKAAIEEIIHDNSRAVATLRNVRALFQRDQVEKSPVDLRQLLLEVERALSGEARSKDIAIRLDLPSSLPTAVGNRIQLLEVLMNLMTNAFDAVCENDDRPREVQMHARESEQGSVRIAIRDTGMGIDPEVMPRLFNAFFTTKPTGLGIGLRIARSIVESHGGRLWATPNPDCGATLEFKLPVKPQ